MQMDASPVIPFAEGTVKYQPIWPTWSTFAKRQESFRTTEHWSKDEIYKLAAVGFFYTGPGDSVRCFYCSLGLQNWQKDDDPLEEHGRHMRSCDYFTNFTSNSCVYNSEIPEPCGRITSCSFCRGEQLAREQLSQIIIGT
ncbi:baculoviral IAP repeat-containing protein 3-like [Anopheles coustani]|uniref:baculoviral IAP repeat-containing protein 3-like n=1 Tax=Anopheles coustani TaxID=139045 RepID=UPI0026596495|nr:baculoviral IAP repeat-containing protein 3-like [Anopheles coustani]